jgi:hypothetical protein
MTEVMDYVTIVNLITLERNRQTEKANAQSNPGVTRY